MGIDPLHRCCGMFVTGACYVGIHIVLREANLAADLVGMDLPFSDQIVYGGFADMEDVSHLLRGQGLILCHGAASLGL